MMNSNDEPSSRRPLLRRNSTTSLASSSSCSSPSWPSSPSPSSSRTRLRPANAELEKRSTRDRHEDECLKKRQEEGDDKDKDSSRGEQDTSKEQAEEGEEEKAEDSEETLSSPLLLTIRPSVSTLPDIHLDVASPSQTTVARLKMRVREHLGLTHNRRKIRLIYRGKILEDGAVLGHLIIPPPPPPPKLTPRDEKGYTTVATGLEEKTQAWRNHDGKKREDQSSVPKDVGKGVQDSAAGVLGKKSAKARGKQPVPLPLRVFVNASIGEDTLSAAQLKQEATQAAGHFSPVVTAGRLPFGIVGSRHGQMQGAGQAGEGRLLSNQAVTTTTATTTTTPAPRGFDRLLTAGFTRSEVNSLRLQFRSIHEGRHTRDTMPSSETLRDLEDRWIDTNAYAPTSVDGSGGGGAYTSQLADDGISLTTGGVTDDEMDEGRRMLDIALVVMAVGFFWPLGTAAWLIRERDLWPRSWHFLATAGFVCSLVIGIFKSLTGEW